MRITDVITKKKENKEVEKGEENSPLQQADWEDADELINDENGFVNPKDVPDVDKYIRAHDKKIKRLMKKDK